MSLVLMKSVPDTGKANLPLDEAGFLMDPKSWNRDLALQLAECAGLGGLDDTQWLIIEFIRDKYFRLGALPPMRHVCRKFGVSREAVKSSFGTCRELWQIAGLPNPGEEVLSYMG